MKIPSSRFGRTTSTVGFFETDVASVASWLDDAMGDNWKLDAVTGGLGDLIAGLGIGQQFSQQLLVPSNDWTAMFTDGPLGSDVGVLPSRSARDRGVRGLRATTVDKSVSPYEATILEVFETDATDNLQRCRRSVYAANDGGRWAFGTSGEPFDFEDTHQYTARMKRDRFDAETLYRYLGCLGVPFELNESDVIEALILTRQP